MSYSPVLATIAIVVGAFLGVLVIGGAITAILASGESGDEPGKCRNADIDLESATSPGLRDAPTDPALAQQFQQRWDEFNAQLNGGSPGSVTFEEGEVTSRAAQWAEDTDAPLEDITVCIYDGIAQGRARAELPVLAKAPLIGGLFESDVSATGRIDLSGEHPEITIVEIEAGDIPDWAIDPVEDEIEEVVNERLSQYDIDHTYEVAYREGQVEITGQP